MCSGSRPMGTCLFINMMENLGTFWLSSHKSSTWTLLGDLS